jgi:hypothetical protein
VLDERDVDGELAVLRQELLGAVERIDQPVGRPRRADRGVGRPPSSDTIGSAA